MNEGVITNAYAFGPVIFASDLSSSIDVTIKLTKKDVIEKIKDGKHKGLSPEMKIRSFLCSICNEDYEYCTHIEGKTYDDILCRLAPHNIEFLNVSFVDNPQDEKARINDLLVIEKSNKKIKYSWYGFALDKDDRRFKHIQKAMKSGFISEKIALKFSTFFTTTLIGTATYP